MTERMFTPDVENVAWEVFTASLDVVQLEGERMRVVSVLAFERPGCRTDRQGVWEHERRAVKFWLHADSGSWSALPCVSPVIRGPVVKVAPVRVVRDSRMRGATGRKSRQVGITSARQLEIAVAVLARQELALNGRVRQSGGPTGSNSSTRPPTVSTALDANEDSTARWNLEPTGSEQAA